MENKYFTKEAVEVFKDLTIKAEQLRIIKNLSKLPTTTIYDVKHLIEAMEKEAPANE